MYQLIWDNIYPLYDPRDSSLRIRDPDVHLAVGEAGEITFTIDPDHPYASRLTRLKGVVTLMAGGQAVFRGRIRKDTQDFNLSREITVEGLLACLNDSIIPPFKFPEDFRNKEGYAEAAIAGKLPEFFLTWLLYEHNSQVGEVQKIQLGEVTVTAADNSFALESTDYAPALEVVRKLEGVLGGYLLPDYVGLPTVLHCYAELPLTNVQEVEFGSNLLDLVSELDSTETHTAILPLGKDGLTIEDLEDGEISPGIWKQGRVVYSQEAEDDLGGRITRKVEWSEVLNASELRDMAAALLTGEGVKTAETITIKAVDLGSVEDLPRFVVGRQIRLTSGPHGYSRLYPLMELNPDIMDPGNTEITLGSTAATVSGLNRETRLAAQTTQAMVMSRLASQQVAITAQQEAIAQQQAYAVQQAADLDEIPQTIQTQVTAAVQTSESIIYTALERYVETSNFQEFQQTVESQFSLMADELVLRFTEATDQTRAVDGDLQRTLETLTKYFEFGQDGLTIRAGENTMSLHLDNDMIIFEKNGQQFGWWDGVDFHTGNIVIGVTERAQFGSFAFIPRANGLSFLEVGD